MLFDSTVRKELAQSFGVTLVVIFTIVLTSMLIKTLGQAAGGNVAPQDVLLLMGYAALSHLSTMLTLSLFIAVVATLGRMYRESEMAIWFASGLALTRFVKPVLRMAWPVALVIVGLELFVWPWGNQNSAQLRDHYEKRGDLSRVAPGQFQTSRDGSRVFFIERDSEDGRTGRNVFILAQQPGHESITTSSRGHIDNSGDDRFLVLEKGQRNETNTKTDEKTVSRFEQYRVLADSQAMKTADTLPPKATPTQQLLLNRNARNDGELAWRFGWICACLNMVLLAIGMAANNPRRANNWNLLFALLAFVVYFNLINLSQTWVTSGRASLPAAVLGVHGGAFVLALLLMWLRDQGNRMGVTRRAPAAHATTGAAA
ncbi:LPS export ABC transporter permease LptF [Pelomonas sp. KK5]|uniref:LPS export ABC transporter permease LptF n=1 Tax=Pelomonas sp. KK5 TaxID=1855730 RepID=UPI00097C4C1A|nr:LPS export ABC transporter permease LptF [Pelomonas sp. KK5]